jgi:hypothetical protein
MIKEVGSGKNIFRHGPVRKLLDTHNWFCEHSQDLERIFN